VVMQNINRNEQIILLIFFYSLLKQSKREHTGAVQVKKRD